MNIYDLNSYENTYQDSRYWENQEISDQEKRSNWADCRALTDKFFDELVTRGYLVRHKDPKNS